MQQQLTQLTKDVLDIQNTLTYSEIIAHIYERGLAEMSVSIAGIHLTPIDSPHELRKYLSQTFGISFFRDKNEDGSYRWETTIMSARVYIEANEYLDFTGTEVTEPKPILEN